MKVNLKSIDRDMGESQHIHLLYKKKEKKEGKYNSPKQTDREKKVTLSQ